MYWKIIEHALDPLELFVLPEDKKNALILVMIGKSQNASDFQDVPLSVKVADAVPRLEKKKIPPTRIIIVVKKPEKLKKKKFFLA